MGVAEVRVVEGAEAAVVVAENEFMMEIEKNTRTVVDDVGHILLNYVMVAFLLNGAFGISLLFNEFFGMWSAIELQDWLEPPLIYVPSWGKCSVSLSHRPGLLLERRVQGATRLFLPFRVSLCGVPFFLERSEE